MQRYGYVPLLTNLCKNKEPGKIEPLSKFPSAPFSMVPLVMVWNTLSSLAQATFVFTLTVSFGGTKQLFLSSHPGREVPSGMLITGIEGGL